MREAAQAMAATLGVPIEVDPKDAILGLIYESAGLKAWYRIQVEALDPSALVWGTTKTSRGLGPQGPVDITDEAAAVNLWLSLFNEERDRLAKLSVDAVKIGLDERKVRLEEARAVALADELRVLGSDAAERFDFRAEERAAFAEMVIELLQRLDRIEAGVKV